MVLGSGGPPPVSIANGGIKPDSLHPVSQSHLACQGPIPKLGRPPLVAVALHRPATFAFANFPFVATFAACDVAHGAAHLQGTKCRE
jgi:hypothetical protein